MFAKGPQKRLHYLKDIRWVLFSRSLQPRTDMEENIVAQGNLPQLLSMAIVKLVRHRADDAQPPTRSIPQAGPAGYDKPRVPNPGTNKKPFHLVRERSGQKRNTLSPGSMPGRHGLPAIAAGAGQKPQGFKTKRLNR